MARGRPKGLPKSGGRKAGTPNKLTQAAKDNIAEAFSLLGGVEGLVKWAQANPTQFYTSLYTKIVPLNHEGAVGLTVQWPLPPSMLEK